MSQAAAPTTSKLLAALDVASSALASDTTRRIAAAGVAVGAMAAALPADATVVVQNVNQFLGVDGSGTPLHVTLNSAVGLSFTALTLGGINGSTIAKLGVVGSPVNSHVAFGAAPNSFAAPGGRMGFAQAYGSTVVFGPLLASTVTSVNGTKTDMPAPGTGVLDYGFEFFNAAGSVDFGWLSGSNTSVNGVFGFNLQSVVTEDNGKELVIGTTQDVQDVPEPASAGLLALGAMITGAVGTRRFKRNRSAA
jgi:hypothetical protein